MYLIKPSLDITLPLFVEMSIRNHVVPFGRHGETTKVKFRRSVLQIPLKRLAESWFLYIWDSQMYNFKDGFRYSLLTSLLARTRKNVKGDLLFLLERLLLGKKELLRKMSARSKSWRRHTAKCCKQEVPILQCCLLFTINRTIIPMKKIKWLYCVVLILF